MLLVGLMAGLLQAASAGAPVTPEGREAVASVEAAIAATRALQAAMPPAADDKERLARLGQLDQAGRKVVVAVDFSRIPQADRMATTLAVGAVIDAVDAENQAELLKLVPPEGWFLKSRYGEAASSAAFHIVQHADEDFWRRFVPVLEPFVAQGEVDGQSYAMMFDRLATSEGRPQRYGTQFRCDNGKWRPYPIEAVETLETRREAMAFPMSFAFYRAYFEDQPPCPQTLSAPPPGMVVDD